jgi:hypothetical protein
MTVEDSTSSDVTGQQPAEALAASEAKLRALLEAAVDAAKWSG